MEKYITSIKDLVIQAMVNVAEIKAKADEGDAESCIKMGMVYLLGINTAINFNKARKHLSNQLLAGNTEVNNLLGLIDELNGNFSQAFHYYAKNDDNENASYIDKIIIGRNSLQNYLNKLSLPLELNKEITVLLNEYGAKKKSGKLGVSVKLAAICGDEFTCLEAAEATYKAKDYFSAKNWLNIGGVDSSNPIYGLIEKKIKETRQALLENVTIQVIDVKGCSLVPAINPDLAYAELKKDCSRIALESQERWKKGVRKIIETILKKQKEEERRLEIEEKDRKDKRKEIIIFLFFLIGFPLVGCLVDNRFELKFILLGAFFGLMAYVLCILFRMAIIEIKERLNI